LSAIRSTASSVLRMSQPTEVHHISHWMLDHVPHALSGRDPKQFVATVDHGRGLTHPSNARTERRGRPGASALATDMARPRSLECLAWAMSSVYSAPHWPCTVPDYCFRGAPLDAASRTSLMARATSSGSSFWIAWLLAGARINFEFRDKCAKS